MRESLAALVRFCLVGILNTALGLGVILALEFVLHVPSAAANLLGYVVGWVVSYGLHRKYVFSGNPPSRGATIRYVVAVALSFSLNQTVLSGCLHLLGGEASGRLLAQMAGVIAYSGTLFVLCRWWVFAARSDRSVGV